MKHINQRNMKIVDEIMMFCLNHGCHNIDLNLKREEKKTTIFIKAHINDLPENIFNEIRLSLSTPRRPEMEEYYWNLNGDDDTDCELALVGMMTDDVNIEYNNNELKIELVRLT